MNNLYRPAYQRSMYLENISGIALYLLFHFSSLIYGEVNPELVGPVVEVQSASDQHGGAGSPRTVFLLVSRAAWLQE